MLENSMLYKKINLGYEYVQKDNLNIAYGVDDNYARYMLVSMCSFCENNGSRLNFHIITDEISAENYQNLVCISRKYKVAIDIYCIKTEGIELPIVTKDITIGTYFRIFLPDLLDNIGQIVYIDADVICVNNIMELQKVDLKDKLIAGVTDVAVMQKRKHLLGLEGQEAYINAGFIIIDVNQWKRINMLEKIAKTLAEYGERIRFEDQDLINIILRGKIKYMPIEYNWLNMRSDKVREAKILHFAAQPKPWSKYWHMNPNCNDYTEKIYSEYEKILFTPQRDSADVKRIIRWIIKLIAYKTTLVRGKEQEY
mgnify:CR=1 FL=1